MPSAVPSWAAVLMMPEAPPRQRWATSVPRLVAGTEDTPMPSPATAAHSGTAQADRAAGISAASAAAMVSSPAAIIRCGDSSRCSRTDSAEPTMTSRLSGSSVTAAASGVRCSVSCRYNVTSVITELVVAVLRKLASVPRRSRRLRRSGAGSSGAAARRSTARKTATSTTLVPSSSPPTIRSAGWVMTVVPTTNAMTAAVKTADPARFSEVAGRSSAPAGTEITMAAAIAAASGR